MENLLFYLRHRVLNAIIKLIFFDKIPILSWILLLGKCRCKMVKIPKIYLFMELFVAVLTLCIVFAYSLSPLFLFMEFFSHC